jgi:hypothetical protein
MANNSFCLVFFWVESPATLSQTAALRQFLRRTNGPLRGLRAPRKRGGEQRNPRYPQKSVDKFVDRSGIELPKPLAGPAETVAIKF